MSSLIDQLKIPVLTVLIAILSFFLLTKLLGPIPFAVNSVQTMKNDLFTVEGVGEATGVPETAQFTVGVTETATTVEDAQQRVNSAISKITDELKKLGIAEKNLKTTNYNVNPNIDYTTGSQRTTGYIVNAMLEVKLDDASIANKALDAATKSGANVVNGVTFVLSDEDREKLEKQARESAIKDAKEKAQEISEEVGIRLGRIINVYVNPNLGPIPYDKITSVAEGRGAGGAPTELQPGENVIRVSVSISYETL